MEDELAQVPEESRLTCGRPGSHVITGTPREVPEVLTAGLLAHKW